MLSFFMYAQNANRQYEFLLTDPINKDVLLKDVLLKSVTKLKKLGYQNCYGSIGSIIT